VSDYSNLPASSKGPILPGQVVWQPADRQVIPTEPEPTADEPPELPPRTALPSRPFAVMTASGAGLFLLGLLLIVTPHVVAERPGQSDRFAYVGVAMALIGSSLLVVGIYRAGVALQNLTRGASGTADEAMRGGVG
jgi:hypothetical protein